MPSDPEVVVVTQGLTRYFDETAAVRELSIEVRRGEIFGFLGHNGAGKTTTVRLLNGVLAASSGSVRVLGLDPARQGPALRARTGVLTETPSLDERLTARENLTLFARLFDVPESRLPARVEELLLAFELEGRGGDQVGEYSKGMKQRLALARALLHEPEILFLDEPTGGLDPVATRQVHHLVRDLSQEGGRTIFLCTHNLAEAQKLCHRVGVMEQGRLIALGTPAELAQALTTRLRIELEVAPEAAARARALLEELPDLHEVAGDGETGVLTAAVDDRESLPVLLRNLVQAGVGVYRLTPQEPTLEDVYFALHADGEVER